MPIETLAFNDVLNNDIAHFFKSGNIRRSKNNDKLTKIHHLLPKKGNYGTNLEYDIWYEFGKEEKITGYLYTDVMTKFVYLKPASTFFCKKVLKDALNDDVTEEGEKIFQDIAKSNTDKYALKKTDKEYPYVIFLAGTNILQEITDEVKVKKAVDKEGAILKPHPLTSPFVMAYLRNRYGKQNLLDRKLSGHNILNKTRKVGCTSNSEMGLIGLSQGKRIELFDRRKIVTKTYTPIYAVLYEKGYPVIDDFKRILSSEYSGLISHLSEDPKKKIDSFFNYFKRVLHVKPKKPKSLDTGRK
jgi:hypothetical protein